MERTRDDGALKIAHIKEGTGVRAYRIDRMHVPINHEECDVFVVNSDPHAAAFGNIFNSRQFLHFDSKTD